MYVYRASTTFQIPSLAVDSTTTCDTTTGAFTVSLPDATKCLGNVVFITKMDTGTNAVTVSAIISQLINGVPTCTVANRTSNMGFISIGTGWVIMPQNDGRYMQLSNNLSDVLDISTARSNIGLGNVTNTSDANKPVSTAQQTAIDLKQSVSTGLSGSYTNANITLDANGRITAISNGSLSISTSPLSLSFVSTGATGTQISATKNSFISISGSTSTTSTIGGPSSSIITLKKCATNSALESDWTTVSPLENDQTITLAVVIQSIQVFKGQLATFVPATWYVKVMQGGTGTHSEGFISGEKTLF